MRHVSTRFLPVAGWRRAALVMFSFGYLLQLVTMCLTIANRIFGCFRHKVFAKETCPLTWAVLIAVASKCTASNCNIIVGSARVDIGELTTCS